MEGLQIIRCLSWERWRPRMSSRFIILTYWLGQCSMNGIKRGRLGFFWKNLRGSSVLESWNLRMRAVACLHNSTWTKINPKTTTCHPKTNLCTSASTIFSNPFYRWPSPLLTVLPSSKQFTSFSNLTKTNDSKPFGSTIKPYSKRKKCISFSSTVKDPMVEKTMNGCHSLNYKLCKSTTFRKAVTKMSKP